MKGPFKTQKTLARTFTWPSVLTALPLTWYGVSTNQLGFAVVALIILGISFVSVIKFTTMWFDFDKKKETWIRKQ